jgi:DNA-binding CsgD family transcriptional regulator
VAAELGALRDRCDARLVAAYAAHASARAAQDGGKLLDVSGTMESIGALRYAAEAAGHAAEAFAHEARDDSSRRAAARCRDLTPTGQGASPPLPVTLGAGHVALTDREVQLVELARRGLSNAEMADRLVLSIRTVESHLYRAMQKLGVSGRRAL